MMIMAVPGKEKMKNEFHVMLKNDLRGLAIQTRDRLGLTQREMSEILKISASSYSDIETGRFCCGALTAFMLLGMQENPNEFVREFVAKIWGSNDPNNGKH